jgi:CheY-like chemotaxis protein
VARVILIADDSPIIQRKAQKILQDEGFEVETVSNGVAAVKKLPALRPVLVLADVSMPGKDGYEVCEFVKTSEELLQVPVLLVGSDLEPYDEQRGAQVRADGIIKKPFTPQDLITIVTKFTGPCEAQAPQPARTDTLVASSPEPRLAEPPEEVKEGPSEPCGAAAEPFPEFEVGLAPELTRAPLPEAASEPMLVSPESSREVEESKPQGADELILTPQLPDSLTPPEAVTESNPVISEPTAEPIPEAAPEPVLVSLKSSREIEEPIPTRQLRDSSTPPDPEWIYQVVLKVVTKMAPPVLAPQQVEELVRILTREITAEINGASAQSDPVPKSQSST